MRGAHLVVAVGPDNQQVLHVRIGNQVLQEFKRCRVQPLQIIEEQRERMLRLGEHAEEPPEHQLKAVLRISRWQVWNGRLFPDNDLHLRDEVGNKLPTRTHRLRQGTPPLVHIRFALDEDLTDQSLESLCQGRVGNVALVLVKLARREKPARRNKHLAQFVHH